MILLVVNNSNIFNREINDSGVAVMPQHIAIHRYECGNPFPDDLTKMMHMVAKN